MPPALSSTPSPLSLSPPSVIVFVAVIVTAALFRVPRSFKAPSHLHHLNDLQALGSSPVPGVAISAIAR
ncbi:hypothetical protein R3P38DRAFT_3245041 [Favolaschia claudopus]|uniref:Uncharacterized protein n=1 Tax=Favolaschia claudopus TaxID=2862362 RepID=A0AAV9Z137_9AGAR